MMVEMIEAANILNNASVKSLVVLDEVGRGTSSYGGLARAGAMSEDLHNKRQLAAKTLFATHYHELVALAESLPRVRNYNVDVREHGSEVVFLRKIVPGGTDRSYGIHVARMAGLPPEVIQRAGEIMATLTDQEQPPPPVSTAGSSKQQIDLFGAREQALQEDFKQVVVENLTPVEALNLLDSLKKKHGL